MFILSQKTIKTPTSWASPELYLSCLPALCLCFMCPVVTKRTGGKRCDGVWEFAPVKRATVALLNEDIHVAVMHTNFRVCGTERGCRARQAITEPTPGTAMDLSHFEACNNHTHTHTNVQLARTISKMLGDILAACAYACVFCNTHVCVNGSIFVAGSLPYFKCTDIFCHYVWWAVVSI